MDDEDFILNFTTAFPNTIDVTTTVPTISPQSSYCGPSFKAFGQAYQSIHGYTSLTVCVFGALANILNLIILTRKEMINPTNAILTGLALADLVNMVEYIPFTIYMNFLLDADGQTKKTYGWAVFVLTHSNFSQVCHTIAIWLTVTLAIWRYIMVAMPLKCKTLCSMERAKWAIASAYITSPILCIPIYLTFSLREIKIPPPTTAPPIATTNGVPVSSLSSMFDDDYMDYSSSSTSTPAPPGDPKYIVNLSELARHNPSLMTVNFWLYSVVIKIIPCIMLTVVSFRLINSLMAAKKRKDKLLSKRTGNHAVSPGGNQQSRGGGGSSDHESSGSDRTTRMLLAVLLLFLITEFPQGLLLFLSGILGDSFLRSCYQPLADLMDFVALLNSAINFILYCSMSKKFRDTFSQVFRLNVVMKLVRRRSAGGRTRTRLALNSRSSPSTNRQLLADHQDYQDDTAEVTAV